MKRYNIENGVLIAYIGNAVQPQIPNGITEIGDCAFLDCMNITIAKIPNGVKRIGHSVFSGCFSLTSIDIPNSVKTIDSLAFLNCVSLQNITIPNSVSYIGYNAFDGIRKVKTQYNANGSLRAFKGFKFNNGLTCRGFRYEVGKSYHQDGIIQCCKNGFHACTNPLDVFNHYEGFLDGLRFAEVEMSGDLDFRSDKVAASDIKIVRELSAIELADIYNSMEKF
jgi:hypothetical protein